MPPRALEILAWTLIILSTTPPVGVTSNMPANLRIWIGIAYAIWRAILIILMSGIWAGGTSLKIIIILSRLKP